MRALRFARAALILAAFTTGDAVAQVPETALHPPASDPSSGPGPKPDDGGWSFSASAYLYLLSDDSDYLQPTVTADRGRLHLEARYNYEGLDTGSLWIGCNLATGEAIELEFTPMAAVVVGDTTGFAPGYRGSIGWWELELYSEGEYVFDTHESADSFFFMWSELSWSPLSWFRIGFVGQRTRVHETERDIQRGLLLGLSVGRLDLTGYVLNPDDDGQTVVLAAAVEF